VSMSSPVFPAVAIPSLISVALPPLYRVSLSQPSAPALPDPEERLAAAIAATDSLAGIAPGAEIAIAVGSRGIARIARLVRASVDAVRARGFAPFIVPAMGSHGGGTPQGQLAVLAKLGVTEETAGAPIRASMDVVELGRLEDGMPVCFDAHAAGAAAVMVIARVKSHTSFDRDIESGLSKMVAIGLGKQAGARSVHRLGPHGLRDVLPAAARLAIANSPLAFGIAVVENARHEIVELEGVPAADFLDADRRLLKRAKSLLARLPFDQLDVLVCEELGKEISGAGMDYGVIARTDIRGIANPQHIAITKIALLRLTARTAGNGVGVGVADFMPRETANALDLKAMYENAITAAMAEKVRIPIVLPSDREVLQASMATCWAAEPAAVRWCQIRNTLSLDEVLVSRALWQELGAPGDGDGQQMRFDPDGRLETRV